MNIRSKRLWTAGYLSTISFIGFRSFNLGGLPSGEWYRRAERRTL